MDISFSSVFSSPFSERGNVSILNALLAKLPQSLVPSTNLVQYLLQYPPPQKKIFFIEAVKQNIELKEAKSVKEGILRGMIRVRSPS